MCSYCKLTGHLAKVCLKKSAAAKSDSRSTNKSNPVQTNYVDQTGSSQCAESVEVREVCTVESSSRCKKFLLDVSVNDKCVRFEVDTGSPVSIISAEDKNRLFPAARLRKCDTDLVSYCNTSVDVLGILDASVEFGGNGMKLPLYVVNSGKHPLLGREWLKVMSVDWNCVFLGPSVVNTIAATASPGRDAALKALLESYPKVFDSSIGRISNVQANLPLKKNARPVFLKARKIPFSMVKTVEDELEKLVAEGVLTKVNSSNWATPIVPVKKSQNRVRICGDYKQTVNPNLVVDKHPLPTVDELFASLAGGKKFSKIDLVQAYLQLEVAPEDRELLTLSTHRGLYRPNRLMYGVASAPAIWQRQMEVILQGIEGVSVFLDDIKITGENDEVHLRRLEEVLRRLNECGIRVNKEKCEFFVDNIEYCGYSIDKDGIHKIQQKVQAIQDMPRPKDVDEVRSFVGFVNYYGRFFQNLSTVLYPLNNLLKSDVPFRWTKQCEDSFRKVKELVQSDDCLAHYSPELPLLLATDASPYGVGAVLSHVYPDGTERPIQFASQTLSRVQQKYMQVDKEAYAVIFGVKKFFQYLYGRRFTLLTDNQAISKIFGEHKGLPVMSALRMQHYATYLQSFDYEIRFRKSGNHANADAMSRFPLDISDPENEIEESDAVELSQIDTLPLTAAELGQVTAEDHTVQKLIQGIKHGQSVEAKDRFGVEQHEFSLQKGCLLRGIRVYVPAPLQKRVLEELHSTHFGTTRTKSLARGYCWWPGLDRDIEDMVANCADCQSVRAEPAKMNLHCWETPTAPFQRVHVDFAGPYLDTYFFIYVDAYSKWPEVQICRSITAESTVNMCREIFSKFGIPSVLVSDHGVQFTSEGFQQFLKTNGVVHKMGAPYHPATNGQAERYVQTIKQKLKALKCTKSQLNLELCNILLTYRKMIHPSTGKSPSMLVFGRQIRSRLDLLLPKNETSSKADIVVRQFLDGDRVRVRDFLSKDKWKFGRIAEKLGKLRYAVRLDDGRIWERHIDHIVGVGVDLQDVSVDTPREEEFIERYEPTISAVPAVDPAAAAAVPAAAIPEGEAAGTTPVVSKRNAVTTSTLPSSPERSTSTKDSRSAVLESTTPLRRSSRIIKPPHRLNL